MSWYDAFKDLTKLADRIKDAELYKLIATLQMEGAHLAEDNARLREENLGLREQLSLKEKLEFEDNLYWEKAEDGEREGPFCPRCYPEKGKAVRMTETRDSYIDDFYKCPVCNTKVEDLHGTPKQSLPGPEPYMRS